MARPSSLKASSVCRGEGIGYMLVSSKRPHPHDLCVRASIADGRKVPARLMRLDTDDLLSRLAPGAADAWVVAVPLLDVDVTVELMGERAVELACAFPQRSSKIFSRMLTTLKPDVASTLRGFERVHEGGVPALLIREVWPKEFDRVVWRVELRCPEAYAAETLGLEVYNGRAHRIPAAARALEDHEVPNPRDARRSERVVTFSVEMDGRETSFFVVASAGDAEIAFAGMNAPRAEGMMAGARALIGGAATDGAYPAYFERVRVTPAELAWQRQAASQTDGPLISVVMCVFKPERLYFERALESVLAQSWPHFELVLVNVSGDDGPTNEVISALDDGRVKVIVAENRSIAENTNLGIEATSGSYVSFMDHDDVLEPDALYHVAMTIRDDPEVDLIYTDEDHLIENTVATPAFKTYPNLGKLYHHNYVTHLLVVSRWVLDRTERTPAEFSGSQDYDLTLRAFEVARHVTHIPRVLYHWREHALSTAGGRDQKPYAHEAGRRALAAHLERRGIAAEVEAGPVSCSYHVRYELDRPSALVSIIIPTSDQPQLLKRCVSSIIERSTYHEFEIILVENNSKLSETYALYNHLVAADARVRCVTWVPDAQGPAFNYSAIVNFGAQHATGDYLILLNNDTEVIEPAWIEELMGQLMRPEVGVVGAKLLFEDGLIQHVGMVANPDGNLCHVCQNLSATEHGAGFAATMPGDYHMVTGACQMIRAKDFVALGGYDERLAVGYNDADFCLRAFEAGLISTVAERALLYHKEFGTRGREILDVRLKARLLQERSYMIAQHPDYFGASDPSLNPNVDPYSAYFSLRRDLG